jgi:hypothetical protein
MVGWLVVVAVNVAMVALAGDPSRGKRSGGSGTFPSVSW